MKTNRQQSFTGLQREAVALVENKQCDAALELLEEGKVQYPERLDRIGHWKAGIYMLLGKKDRAVTELQQELDQGVWWNPSLLEQDEELAPLQGSEEFQRILSQCAERFEEADRAASAELETTGNPEADVAIVALHWKGSNAADFAAQWSDPVILARYFFGFVQSSQVFSKDIYHWDDPDTAAADVTSMYQRFYQSFPTEKKRILAAGASQGGKTVIELLLQNKLPEVESFLAFVPSFTDVDKLAALFGDQDVSDVKGCVITGDEDPFYEETKKVVELLQSKGADCRLMVIEGMGHRLPDELAENLQEAVDYLE